MTTETTSAIDPRINNYDWEHIFENYTNPTHVRTKLARGEAYGRADVAEVVAIEDGENDGAEWVGVFHMNDGRFLVVRAGCDYTGWGCQEGGCSDSADTLEDAISFGLTAEERTRLAEQLTARAAGA